jgi:hypothetical protein
MWQRNFNLYNFPPKFGRLKNNYKKREILGKNILLLVFPFWQNFERKTHLLIMVGIIFLGPFSFSSLGRTQALILVKLMGLLGLYSSLTHPFTQMKRSSKFFFGIHK